MTRTKKAMITGLFIAISLSVTACGPRHYDEKHRSQWIIQRISEKLDLNKAQQEKLKAINAEILIGQKKYRDKQQQLLESLIEDVQAPTMNKKLLMEVVDSREKAYSDIAPRVADKIIDFQASLNEAQKKKVAEYLQHWRDRVAGRNS
jgi:outer membrane PBP1 activator LpoA protein